MCEAARLGHVRTVEVLLADPRVSPISRDGDALRYASEAGHVAVVERRLALPGTGSSLLHHVALQRALSGEHFPIMRMLLEDRRAAPSLRAHVELLTNVFSHLMWTERLEGLAATGGPLSIHELRLAAEVAPPPGTYGRRDGIGWLRRQANARVLCAAAWARRRAAVLCRAQMMMMARLGHLKL